MGVNVAGKSDRILLMYSRLVNGEILSKKEMAEEFHVTERSIQRDIEALRCFFQEEGVQQEIAYERKGGGYCLRQKNKVNLTEEEILAVCKILMKSRSLRKEEMFPILNKIMENNLTKEKCQLIEDLVSNEKFHYIEPHHEKYILPTLWELALAVKKQCVVELEYERMKEPKFVKRIVEPVGILFSEYYFYLAAFLRNVDRKEEFENKDDIYPTIYRIDRIKSYHISDEHFHVTYKERFEEGEFQKRVQFMYGGKQRKIRFKYTGLSVEAVLDRLPTAKIIGEDGDSKLIEAEVIGDGVEMWLRSQGDSIEMCNK